MDLKRVAVTRAVVWLMLGLTAGGIAADRWGRQERQRLTAQVQELRATAATESARTTEARSKLASEEQELARLKQELAAERDLRHRYEDLVAKGRK